MGKSFMSSRQISSEEPAATPLPVTRARGTYLGVGVAATVVIAVIVGGLLLTLICQLTILPNVTISVPMYLVEYLLFLVKIYKLLWL